MEEIKVGEYVRTVSGSIDKVDALYGMIENTIHLENHKWQDIKNILKHSPNIIDLIEVDDICIIDDKLSGFDCVYIYDESFIEAVKEDARRGYKIKSILTKELYEQNCYKLEE